MQSGQTDSDVAQIIVSFAASGQIEPAQFYAAHVTVTYHRARVPLWHIACNPGGDFVLRDYSAVPARLQHELSIIAALAAQQLSAAIVAPCSVSPLNPAHIIMSALQPVPPEATDAILQVWHCLHKADTHYLPDAPLPLLRTLLACYRLPYTVEYEHIDRWITRHWRNNAVIHGDLRRSNMMCNNRGVLQLIDWEKGGKGLAMWDVAQWLAYRVGDMCWHQRLSNSATAGIMPERLFNHYYTQVSPWIPLSIRHHPDFRMWLGIAFFRYAIELHEQAPAMQPLAKSLLHIARGLLEKTGCNAVTF